MAAMEEVTAILPHRQPMLMVDRVLELREDGCAAMKNISYSEPCFIGHFPGQPVFPGVLIIEALAQTCAIWLKQKAEGTPVFAEIREARFLRMVRPGDQLRLEIRMIERERSRYTFETAASVDGVTVCRAALTIVPLQGERGS